MGLLDRFKRTPRTSGQPAVESGRGHDLILGSRYGAKAGLVQPDEYKTELTGQRGFRVFEQMFRSDPDVYSRYMMLGAPFVGATWDVQPYGGKQASKTAQTHADFVKWCLFERMDPGLHAHLMAAWRILRFGIAPFEQVFAWDEWQGERRLVVEQLHAILPRTVWDWPSRGERLEQLVLMNSDGTEVRIGAVDLVYYRLGAEGDNWEGTSLLRHCYKPWKYKDTLELVDAIGHERYHVGMPIGYAGQGASAEQRTALDRVLAGIRSNATGHIMVNGVKQSDSHPEGVLIEILAPDREGSSDLGASIERQRDGISAALFQEFMRLGQGAAGSKGALATADVQQDPMYMLIESFCKVYFEDPLNSQLVARLVALNFPATEIESVGGFPRLTASKIDAVALDQLAAALAQLVGQQVVQVDDRLEDYLRERFDLPAADPEARKARLEAQQAKEARSEELHKQQIEQPKGEQVVEQRIPLPDGGEERKVKRERIAASSAAGVLGMGTNGHHVLRQGEPASGAMVALFPTRAVAEALALDGGEAPEDLHVTLAYLGPAVELDGVERERVLNMVRLWAEQVGQLNGRVGGVGVFDTPDGPATHLSVDIPMLPAARESLVQMLDHAGVPPSRQHGFSPHLTLAYGDRLDDARSRLAGLGDVGKRAASLRFHSVVAVFGDERKRFALRGTHAPVPARRLAQPPERMAHVDFERIGAFIDESRDRVRGDVAAYALLLARAATVKGRADARAGLERAFLEAFSRIADEGVEQVRREVPEQRARTLAQGPRRDRAQVAKLAALAADGVQRSVEGVQDRLAALGTPAEEAARRVEEAAESAADREARDGVTLSLNVGRVEAAEDLGPDVRALYTSLLDANRCQRCADADDGIERTLDDPVRLAHIPPNPECAGWTRCRCLEVYVFDEDEDEDESESDEQPDEE